MGENLLSVVRVWSALLPQQLPWMAALAVAPVLVWLAWSASGRWRGAWPDLQRLPWTRYAPHLLVAAALVVGYIVVVRNASLFDDAYISFRYARNFAEGNGLVWNLGERVEGYTNFLWTLLIGVLHRVTPWEAPGIGLSLSLLCFGANLLVVWRLGRRLVVGHGEAPGPWGGHLPLAVVLLAVHGVFTDYGTSGMETMAGSLLINLGVLFLVAPGFRTRHALGAGVMLVLAALTRPDHGLFYAAGGLAVLAGQVAPVRHALRRWRERGPREGALRLWLDGVRPVAAYALPFTGYALYLAWKIQYYGQLLPNTYYAKSAGIPWWDQCIYYTSAFVLGTHAWIPLLLALAWVLWPTRAAASLRFKVFLVPAVVLYAGYITRVGGDFIYGRFFVPLVPLLFLGAEALIHRLARGRARWRMAAAALAVGLLLATTQALPLHDVKERDEKWGFTDWTPIWNLDRLFPPRVDGRGYQTGKFFGDKFHDRDIDLVIATSGIGMVGYYSRITLIDVRGLTDTEIAHTTLKRRGKTPGHEKSPPKGYLDERGVQLVHMRAGLQYFHPRPYRQLAVVTWDAPRGCEHWMLTHYDRELMERIQHDVPELTFTDFEDHLDEYLRFPPRDRKTLHKDAAWFRRYYFDHNDDPQRQRRLDAVLRSRGVKPGRDAGG